MLNIKIVTVIGANGAMGAAVAGIFASFGNVKVNMVSRTLNKSMDGIEKAVKSVRADSIRSNLVARTYEDLAVCIHESDWVFESVAEDYEIKDEINSVIARYRKPGTIVSTGTSGLSIEKLKNVFDEEAKSLYFVTHFFNPPYSLPLCELIPNESADQETIESLKIYLEQVLIRKVVVLKDAPAFLANRIGFQFMNEALQFAELYEDRGGIDYIDAILGPFTGRGMAPLVTVDFIGLDVYKAITDNLYHSISDLYSNSFMLPQFVDNLINEGKLGRKCGQGLYKLDRDSTGKKHLFVYDIKSQTYRPKIKYSFYFVEKMVAAIKESKYEEAIKILLDNDSEEAKICSYFLIKYVVYSVYVTNEIAYGIHDADTVMAYGFNWVPPLALLELFGGKEAIIEFMKTDNRLIPFIPSFNTSEIFPSKLNYRRYLRAKF
ncbi:3-hydroxyacyl-CoA dehydrogenase family protein [Paenibacillus pedocola]|uniref:3-hydroxyacyl-CoA dehydrogenase family protein n=1 Tax=Paenibacillus pedocola TaxID=3242193 RepID=UPI002877C263|nr:3-hydroxyacyl-CoA dehydrogenase family protein [Paenibacillus typhae]